AKRSNAADCKSVALAASKVRVLPSPYPLARIQSRASFGARASGGFDVSARDSENERDSGGTRPSASGVVRERGSGLARRSARRGCSERVGGSNSVVESQPSKLLVAGSIPVSRSSLRSPLRGDDGSARQ